MSDRGEEQERLAERVDYAHRQQAIDPFYEEAKEEVGWDQCQGRLTCDDGSGLEFSDVPGAAATPPSSRAGRPRDPFPDQPGRWCRALSAVQRKVAR